jgi:hypothetical protein
MKRSTRPTIAEYVDYWLDLRKDDLASNTHARYCTLARNQVLPYIGELRLNQIKPGLLADLYEELTRSGGIKGKPLRSGTVGQVHRFLHVCFEKATTDGLLANNPMDRVKSPRIPKPPATVRLRAEFS